MPLVRKKLWASEDDILYKVRVSGIKQEPVDFWKLLYPQHPIIRLKPVVRVSENDLVFCLGCETTHGGSYVCQN